MPKKERHFVFSFGRMNPPHAGHAKLADAVVSHARKVGGDHAVILSQSHGGEKNPLPPDVKHGMAKKVLPNANVVSDENIRHMGQAFEYAKKKGYSHAHLVVGGDRHAEMSARAEKIANAVGIEVNVVNAGHRDPDSEGVEGASATKVRAAANENNINKFRSHMPRHISNSDAKEMMATVHHHLNTANESVEWFDEQEFLVFLGEQTLLDEAAKYLRPDLYLIRKRKQNKVEVVVRPDPDDDVVLKGGVDKQKPTITDVMNHIKKGEFKQTPTSIQVFGDLSAEIRAEEPEEQGKADSGGAVGAAGGSQSETGRDPAAEVDDADVAAAAEQEGEQALDLSMPMGSPVSLDAIEYPRPTKQLSQNKGVQFEWALIYSGLKSAGFSDEQLSQRDMQTNNNLLSFSKDSFDLAKSTMKNIPQELRADLAHSSELGIAGDPEPKTDIVSGDNRISVKMDGQIQLSSESSKKSAQALAAIAANLTSKDAKFTEGALKSITKSLSKMPQKMIDPNNLEEAKMRHNGKPWFEEMLDVNGEIKDEYNWAIQRESVTPSIQKNLIKYLDKNEDFKRALIHEALTGQVKFADNEAAAATHLLYPDGFTEIGESDGQFVDSLKDKTVVGIRAKSRKRITQPTFRFELKGNKIERITEAVDVKGSSDYIYTPEKLQSFYSQNPDTLTQETMGSIESTVSGDMESETMGSGSYNIIIVNGKEKKIPITGAEITDDIDVNEIFLSEQNDPSKRDYKREYRLFHGKAKQRKKRSNRVLARRKMIKKGKAKKGDGKDIDHKDGNALNNGNGNLRVRSIRSNRADNKHKKGEKHQTISEEGGAGEIGTDELLHRYIKDTPFMSIIGFKQKKKGTRRNDRTT